MKEEEQAEILRADKSMDGVNGIIFGRELGTGKVLSLPVNSRLNLEYSCLRLPRFYEIQSICKGDGITMRTPWGEHVYHRSKV